MDPELFAYSSYTDAPAAVTWLQEALGFTLVRQQPDGAGGLAHAELRLGRVVLMIASKDADYEVAPVRGVSTGHGLYLLVDAPEQVDHLFTRAVAAGARELVAPQDTEWGTRRARVLDLEGYEWSVGTYEPGRAWD